MTFGAKVKRPSKTRTIEVSSNHMLEHLHAFLLASGLVARDEVIGDCIFPGGQSTISNYLDPKYITVQLKKVKTKNGQEG